MRATLDGPPSPRSPRNTCLAPLAICGVLGLIILVAPSAPDLSAFHPGHHKQIAVTLLDGAGSDYPCDDSDGPDTTSACQIHCVTAPCMEPYRLCLAHLECTAIAVNEDLTFATLKKQLFAHAEANSTALRTLAAHDLVLDLLVNRTQLEAVGELADALPELRINVNHLGYPDVSAAKFDVDWAAQMRKLASRKNVYAKLSGLLPQVIMIQGRQFFLELLPRFLLRFKSKPALFLEFFPFDKLLALISDGNTKTGSSLSQLANLQCRQLCDG